MPSYEHEGLIRLFRNRPELAVELLRDVLRVELPAYSEARAESADLTDLEPAERHADLVVLLVDEKPVVEGRGRAVGLNERARVDVLRGERQRLLEG